MKKTLCITVSFLMVLGCVTVFAEEIEKIYGDFVIVENEDNVTITRVAKSNLVNVTIPGEINEKKVKLEPRLFEGMASLESVKIEEGIVEIPGYAFHKCVNLKNVELPETLETIGEWAFRECSLNEIVIPESVSVLGKCSFRATKITSIRIPDKITHLDNYIFAKCEDLTFVDLNNVEVLKQGAFEGCLKLEKVVHNGNLSEWGAYVFENCPILSEIDIENVKVFSSDVFRGNQKIEYIYVPKLEEAELIADRFVANSEKPYFIGETGKIGSRSAFANTSFSGMEALKIARVNLANFEDRYNIQKGVLFFENPNLEVIIYENFTPVLSGKWLCHEYDLTKPRNANLVLYGNEAVKAYAESIGVPFKELIDVYLNGERIWMDDCLPYIKNDRTLVPMRAIFEALGAEVSWDDTTKTAIGLKDGVEIKITIGENVLYKNGEAITLDAVAEITNDRTMVPVRAISEAFGCTVNWNGEMKTVEITN